MHHVTQTLWSAIAWLITCRPVTNWLIARSFATPYQHILSADKRETYMERYWLLNPYDNETGVRKHPWFPWSVRIHRIMVADRDRHLHDHPWNARTIILRGWYREYRLTGGGLRVRGDTHALRYREYHRITNVSPGGVWTLFITGPKRGSWGFLVDGVHIPWREYLGVRATQQPNQGRTSTCSSSPAAPAKN